MKAEPSRESCYSSLNFKRVVSHVSVQHNGQGFEVCKNNTEAFTVYQKSLLKHSQVLFQKSELTKPRAIFFVIVNTDPGLLGAADKCLMPKSQRVNSSV